MKAIITFTVTKEIEVPEGTLTLAAKRIVQHMTPEELVVGVVMKEQQYVDLRLPHASTRFQYPKDPEPLYSSHYRHPDDLT